MSNRRRQLNSVHRTIARKGINAAAWFAGQSFNSGTRGDMPLERLSIKQLDTAGIGLLPRCSECKSSQCPHATNDDARCVSDLISAREVCPACLGSREVQQQVTDNLTVTAPCAECGGRGYYVEGA